jgi:hypothetical protein
VTSARVAYCAGCERPVEMAQSRSRGWRRCADGWRCAECAPAGQAPVVVSALDVARDTGVAAEPYPGGCVCQREVDAVIVAKALRTRLGAEWRVARMSGVVTAEMREWAR